MIFKMEQHPLQTDIEVLVTYPVRNKTVERVFTLLNSINTQIECYSDDNIKLVSVSDIYYIESTDKKTFICCKNESYLSKFRLYQLNEKLSGNGFVQISKYCIMNINKLDKVKRLFNSRMEAVLSNGSHLCVTRKYLASIKQKLIENE